MTRVEYPYFSIPHHAATVSFREMTELAGRRLPYTAAEYKHPATGFYRPDYVEFMLITAGEGHRTVRSNNGVTKQYRIAAGQLFIFRPMDLQDIRGIGRDGLSVICVAFPLETWERFAIASELDQRIFTHLEPPCIDVDVDDAATLEPFRRILSAWEHRLEAMDLIRFLAETTAWFVAATNSTNESGVPRWLRSAIAAMHEEENLYAGVSRLRELSHVSHTHLWRNTRAYFGLSPSALVSEIRLHHASFLLTATEVPIASVAERCGYSSAAHFSTTFRKSRLMSPREYRAQARTR